MGEMTKGLEVVKIRLVKEEPLMADRYVTDVIESICLTLDVTPNDILDVK